MSRALRTSTLAIVVIAVLPAPARAIDPYFLAGECESAALTDHAWHEFGHDLTSLYVGQKPLNPGSLWGDKWSEATPGFRTIAKGGLLMEIIVSAVEASFEDDPEPSCAPSMNTIGTLSYTARMQIAPNNAGDFDPFSPAGRIQMGISSVTSSAFLEALAEYRMNSSLFADGAPQLAPSLFAAAEEEPDTEVAAAALPDILARAGVVHDFGAPGEEGAEEVASALPREVAVEGAHASPPQFPEDWAP
jgi:hypothetical protein